jgi:hypothetical protein
LLLGVIILAVLVIGYLVPSEFAFSILTAEAEKEQPVKQLEKDLQGISDTEPNPSDREKLSLEKKIVSLEREFKELKKFEEEKRRKGEELSKEEELKSILNIFSVQELKKDWIRK